MKSSWRGFRMMKCCWRHWLRVWTFHTLSKRFKERWGPAANVYWNMSFLRLYQTCGFRITDQSGCRDVNRCEAQQACTGIMRTSSRYLLSTYINVQVHLLLFCNWMNHCTWSIHVYPSAIVTVSISHHMPIDCNVFRHKQSRLLYMQYFV